MNAAPWAIEVEINGGKPLGLGSRAQRRRGNASRIVDQHIDRTQPRPRLGNRRPDRVEVASVRHDAVKQRRLSSLDPIERNRRNIERGDRAALALQFGDDRTADVAAGSRYDHAHLANSSCEVVATGRIADSPWGYPSNLSRSEEHTSELQSLMRSPYA